MTRESGAFGPFGGQFAPETLMPALAELEDVWSKAQNDPEFRTELTDMLRDYVGRETR